ncbi:hypothetical protein KI387_003583, partial [Taxus chinensis]
GLHEEATKITDVQMSKGSAGSKGEIRGCIIPYSVTLQFRAFAGLVILTSAPQICKEDILKFLQLHAKMHQKAKLPIQEGKWLLQVLPWNIRGLSIPNKCCLLHNKVKTEGIDMISLQETCRSGTKKNFGAAGIRGNQHTLRGTTEHHKYPRLSGNAEGPPVPAWKRTRYWYGVRYAVGMLGNVPTGDRVRSGYGFAVPRPYPVPCG